jgi:hypothetical protein
MLPTFAVIGAAGLSLPAETRRRLEEILREDVVRLRTHLGDGFDGWGIA